MKFAQLSILLVALVIALISAVEAGKRKPRGPSQTVRFGRKLKGKSTWFNGHDLKGVSSHPLAYQQFVFFRSYGIQYRHSQKVFPRV